MTTDTSVDDDIARDEAGRPYCQCGHSYGNHYVTFSQEAGCSEVNDGYDGAGRYFCDPCHCDGYPKGARNR